MDKNLLSNYILVFRKYLAPYVKDGISIKTIAYPYTTGAVIVFAFDSNSSNNTEYRSSSCTQQEAIQKTNLFTDTEDAVQITTSKIILAGNYIVVIKNDTGDTWSESAAKNDVKDIIEKLLKK